MELATEVFDVADSVDRGLRAENEYAFSKRAETNRTSAWSLKSFSLPGSDTGGRNLHRFSFPAF